MSAHHGNTPAAWATVVVLIAAFVVGGVGLMLGSMTVFWIGVALLPIGIILGAVLSRMGYGAD